MQVKLRLTQNRPRRAQAHLLPGDGLEAVAVALCGRRRSRTRHCLTVRPVVPIPYDECKVRTPDRVTWSTQRLDPAARRGRAARSRDFEDPHSSRRLFAILINRRRIRRGPLQFRLRLDRQRVSARERRHAAGRPHVRPRRHARRHASSRSTRSLFPVTTCSSGFPTTSGRVAAFAQRHAQLFGAGTTNRLRHMAAAVIGCSGTGSPLIEQLARLGVGRLVLVDPDFVEERNLNRIVNASREDAYLKRPKVEVMARAIAAMGFGTEVEIIHADLATPAAVKAVAECDVALRLHGRRRRPSSAQPARRLLRPAVLRHRRQARRGRQGRHQRSMRRRPLRAPGRLDAAGPQRLYARTAQGCRSAAHRSEGLPRPGPRRIHPRRRRRPAGRHQHQHADGEHRRNEFLARLHPYRYDDNADSAIVRTSFIHPGEYREPEPLGSGMFAAHIGKGDVDPLLSMPELSEPEETA